ncbi:uncharacterized protein ACN427_002240 [Glossina fuscipes fuscipes]
MAEKKSSIEEKSEQPVREEEDNVENRITKQMGIIHEKELEGAVEEIPNEAEKIDPEKRKEKPEQLGEDKKDKEEIAPVMKETKQERVSTEDDCNKRIDATSSELLLFVYPMRMN